jgi:hypothetical protein
MAEAFLPELPDVAAGIDFREVPATREQKCRTDKEAEIGSNI